MSDAKTTKAAKAAAAKAAPVAIVDDRQQKNDVTQAQQVQGAIEVAAEQTALQEPLPPGEDGSEPPTAGSVAPIEPLADYIARVERAQLDQDIVAVAITHPEVQAERVHPGTYGGIRLSAGDVGVTYSDGSKA